MTVDVTSRLRAGAETAGAGPDGGTPRALRAHAGPRAAVLVIPLWERPRPGAHR